MTNSEVLACQTPFILWLRLPYELLLIIDWISQAQLCRLMRDEHVAQLRRTGICGSLDFFTIASSPTARQVLSQTIGLPADLVEAILQSLQTDPISLRLAEVLDALRKPVN
ncbi:hypothetical protein [Bradyrhizobium ivorense]|uniref:hypothetical protein n=1 Tax=Bradyrhizobium ivorense TaxID=2511166 RepID=UPI0010BAAB86|nr:hypothetical protein [Bradyrhizobium ivorense]VIO79230.1 hypothetical protein CI41S_67980 [Bradyrhizobium ivorense]